MNKLLIENTLQFTSEITKKIFEDHFLQNKQSFLDHCIMVVVISLIIASRKQYLNLFSLL